MGIGDLIETIGAYTDLPECPRCGLGHPRLQVRPCAVDGPGKLRAGETHESVCPQTTWKIYYRRFREPATGSTFRLVLELEPTGKNE